MKNEFYVLLYRAYLLAAMKQDDRNYQDIQYGMRYMKRGYIVEEPGSLLGFGF